MPIEDPFCAAELGFCELRAAKKTGLLAAHAKQLTTREFPCHPMIAIYDKKNVEAHT
jgi:hypothetical protein